VNYQRTSAQADELPGDLHLSDSQSHLPV